MSALVTETIKSLVENAEAMSRKPQHLRIMHFVKNEEFVTGSYRIHKQYFSAPALYDEFTEANILQATKELGIDDIVEYDAMTLWLTIYVK